MILEGWCDYGATEAFGYGVRVLLDTSKVLVMDGCASGFGCDKDKSDDIRIFVLTTEMTILHSSKGSICLPIPTTISRPYLLPRSLVVIRSDGIINTDLGKKK
jgi:hypothetical protein